jgi:hypothetical protein
MLIPTAARPVVKRFNWSWVWQQVNTYVLLDKNFDPTKKILPTGKQISSHGESGSSNCFSNASARISMNTLQKAENGNFHLHATYRSASIFRAHQFSFSYHTGRY